MGMAGKKLELHYLHRLQDHLAHARRIFNITTGDCFDTHHDIVIAPEHVVYAFGVYQALGESIATVIDEIGADRVYKDWTPAKTVPGALRGFLLEASVSSGLLLAWKNEYYGENTEFLEAMAYSQKDLIDAVNVRSKRKYAGIEGISIALAKSQRAPEAMQVLGNIRKEYRKYLER